MAKNSSPSRAPKTGAQLRDNPEEREKCVRAAKIPSIATNTNKLHSLHCGYPSLRRTGKSANSGDELNLRHLHCSRDNLSLHDHRDVQPSMNCTKKTSTTLSRYCNCGTSTVFSTTNPDMRNNGHVNNRVQELDTRQPSSTQGKHVTDALETAKNTTTPCSRPASTSPTPLTTAKNSTTPCSTPARTSNALDEHEELHYAQQARHRHP